RGCLKDVFPEDLLPMSLLNYEPDYDEVLKIWRSYKKRCPFGNVQQHEQERGRAMAKERRKMRSGKQWIMVVVVTLILVMMHDLMLL
ncbi:unnamed protein product, partial [Closterium sp. NIES-54]